MPLSQGELPPIEGETEEYSYASIQALKQVLRRLIRVDVNAPNLQAIIESLKVSADLALKNIPARHAGLPHLVEARKRVKERRREEMERRHAVISPIIAKLREENKTSLREIAEALDALGIPTSNGGKWSPGSVRWIEKNSGK